MTVKRIWDKLLNFLFVGLCAILISGCGNEAEIQELDTLKMTDAQGGQSQSEADAVATAEPVTVEPPVNPGTEPTEEPVTENAVESTKEPASSNTSMDYYKVATNKTAGEVEDFARKVKELLLAKDFEKMSELVAYPITIEGERYESREEFLNADFASKVSPDFLENVEAASCEQMFCNYQGIMLGDTGEVWIAEVLNSDLSSAGLKVVALNDLVDTRKVQTPEEVAKTRAAYQAALTTILNELKLPDGNDLYYDGFDEFSQNKFAICDVDSDGMEELVFTYTTGPMAAMGKYVYGYDTEKNKIYPELSAFSMVFYDNGVVLSMLSHNHGRGEQLWPFAVYYYSEPTDDYRFGVSVDSWEEAYYGDTAQGTPFPTEADVDGDGIVYYLMAYDDYSYENPLDGAEYMAWYGSLLEDAKVIELEYAEMTKENIAAVTMTGTTGASNGAESRTGDTYAGTYADKQGTSVVYSDLKLEAQEDGTYKATIGLHRLTTLEGTAKVEGEKLLFADDIMGVKGEITIKEGKAVLTITESSFEYINAGEVFEFPEKI